MGSPRLPRLLGTNYFEFVLGAHGCCIRMPRTNSKGIRSRPSKKSIKTFFLMRCSLFSQPSSQRASQPASQQASKAASKQGSKQASQPASKQASQRSTQPASQRPSGRPPLAHCTSLQKKRFPASRCKASEQKRNVTCMRVPCRSPLRSNHPTAHPKGRKDAAVPRQSAAAVETAF